MASLTTPRRSSRTVIWLVMIGVLAVILFSILPFSLLIELGPKLNLFATVFLGIFIEALPYLLIGTLISGIVEVFVDREQIIRFVSNRTLRAAVTGAFMGLVFPVCECGVIPLARRLFHKGLPLSAGVAFLLAAPVLNPIVIFSTAAAFGWGLMLAWRVGFTLVIAIVVGLVFSIEQNPSTILVNSVSLSHERRHAESGSSLGEKLGEALTICADEFFEMGRYLIIGAMLAATLQTFIPQTALLSVGSGPVVSVLIMQALALVLSICSTVDAFVALGFTGTFSFGSILAFLVFGPMVDIKSMIMYLQVFRRRPVVYLVLLPLLMSMLIGIAFNYFVW